LAKEQTTVDEQTIGLIFAIIAVIVTIGYFALALTGTNLLKEIRDRLGNHDTE
jgi:hypothetical protein